MSLARVQKLLSQLKEAQNSATSDPRDRTANTETDPEGDGGDGDGDDEDDGQDVEDDENGTKEGGEDEQGEDPADDDDEEEEEEEEDEDEDDEPKTIAAFFEDPSPQYDKAYIVHESFHTLYVSKDNRTVLMRLKKAHMKRLFYVQVTYESSEGLYPSMFDITPKNVGLCFLPAPGSADGGSVLLVEAQQSLPTTDLIASLYHRDFNGMQSGFIREFHPIVDDVAAGDILIDVTFWLQSFGIYANAAGANMHTKINELEEADSEGIRGGCCGFHVGTHTKLFNNVCNDDATGSPWLAGFSGQYCDHRPCNSMSPHDADVFPTMPMGLSGGHGAAGSKLLDVASFPENFVAKFRSQFGGYPLKAQPGGPSGMPGRPRKLTTSYFTVGFCLLPENPMVPRPLDHRVGYFTTKTQIGSPTQLTLQEHMINRWNLARRGNKLLFCISSSTPKVYHNTIKQGVLSWNKAFHAAGYKEPVLQCLAPGDVGYPQDIVKGDARYNMIAMAEPPGLLGYGPSIVDFRSGEIVVAHVLLGLSAFSSSASRWSTVPNAGEKPRWSGRGCKMPLLDPTHPWILKELLHTVAHEVGHTLGLRHNFIASEDGHSSVMAYEDPVDTTHLDPIGFATTPREAQQSVIGHSRGAITNTVSTDIVDAHDIRFGNHYCMGPGIYDVYAIKYGYTRLPGESRRSRHTGLDLLANGQEAFDPAGVSAVPQNPLFMTDENMYGERVDPRVNVFVAGIQKMGRDKMAFALQQRRLLLSRVQSRQIVPRHYCVRIIRHLQAVQNTLSSALDFIGGTQVDASRSTLQRTSAADVRALLRAITDFTVGASFRFSEEETKYLVAHSTAGEYAMQQIRPFEFHSNGCEELIAGVLSPGRLEKIEAQFAESRHFQPADDAQTAIVDRHEQRRGSDSAAISALEILTLLGFGGGDVEAALLAPLSLSGNGHVAHRRHTPLDNSRSIDSFRSKARGTFANGLRDLSQSSSAHPSVRAQAMVLITRINKELRAFGVAPAKAVSSQTTDVVTPLPPRPPGMSELAQAHWQVFCDALNREKKEGGGAVSCSIM